MQPAIPTSHPYPYSSEIEALKAERARLMSKPVLGFPKKREQIKALTTKILKEELRNV